MNELKLSIQRKAISRSIYQGEPSRQGAFGRWTELEGFTYKEYAGLYDKKFRIQ